MKETLNELTVVVHRLTLQLEAMLGFKAGNKQKISTEQEEI